jgi:hypothetical protein
VLDVLAVDTLGILDGIAEGAGAADGFVFDVVQGAEQLAVGAVHVGLVAGETDAVEDVGCLVEDAVHFFQRAAGGLGEEEVDDGNDGGVTREVKVSIRVG